MKFLRLKARSIAAFMLLCFLPSCAVKSHQFAHAVYKGNTDAAQSFHEPGYANLRFSVTSAPDKYSLPIQYAILQKNKPMSKFLVDNGSPTILQGKNLAYYCSYNRKDEMAHYFASIGQGSTADINLAKRDLAENERRNREAAKTTALVGLLLLGAIISATGSSSGGGGLSSQEQAAALKYDRSVSASIRAGL